MYHAYVKKKITMYVKLVDPQSNLLWQYTKLRKRYKIHTHIISTAVIFQYVKSSYVKLWRGCAYLRSVLLHTGIKDSVISLFP